jgi:hypothetical protein
MKNHACILLAASLLSSTAYGACKGARWLDTPVIPDGQVATLEQMAEARVAVTEFIESGERYLNCVKPASFTYNHLVGRLYRTAERYNDQRARYYQEKSAVAAN